MSTVVNCLIPRKVEDHIKRKHGLSPLPFLLLATKAYTNQTTSQTASLAVGRMARERGCTKTDIYRLALIMFDPSIEALWPAAKRTDAQIAGVRSYMVDYEPKRKPDPAGSAGKAKLVAVLRTLRDEVPNMTSSRIQARLDAIIKKLEPST